MNQERFRYLIEHGTKEEIVQELKFLVGKRAVFKHSPNHEYTISGVQQTHGDIIITIKDEQDIITYTLFEFAQSILQVR